MSRNTKIILIILAILVILCLCGCVLSFFLLQSIGTMLERSMVTDPTDVTAVGAKIADYEVPAGYSPEFGTSFFGFDLVALTSGEGNAANLIFLMQFPAWVNMDEAQMEEQLRQSIARQTERRNVQLQVVGQSIVTIRDQEVTLTTSEGTDEAGRTFRQVIGVFQGKGGPTMLMIMGRAENWNQAAIDAFIASIR